MKKILSFLFLVCAIPMSAQQVWSLSACIEHAEANNLDIQRGKNNMLLAEINEDQSKLAFAYVKSQWRVLLEFWFDY